MTRPTAPTLTDAELAKFEKLLQDCHEGSTWRDLSERILAELRRHRSPAAPGQGDMPDSHKIARCVRGCATDEQYQELTERIDAAFARIRSDVREEDARVAFEWLGGEKSQTLAPGCAAAIRALGAGER